MFFVIRESQNFTQILAFSSILDLKNKKYVNASDILLESQL